MTNYPTIDGRTCDSLNRSDFIGYLDYLRGAVLNVAVHTKITRKEEYIYKRLRHRTTP